MSERCTARVYRPSDPWARNPVCTKPGKVQVDGQWLCAIHDPSKVTERKAKSTEKWEAAQTKRHKEYAAIRYHDRLVEALAGLVALLDERPAGIHPDIQPEYQVARSLLNEIKEEQK